MGWDGDYNKILVFQPGVNSGSKYIVVVYILHIFVGVGLYFVVLRLGLVVCFVYVWLFPSTVCFPVGVVGIVFSFLRDRIVDMFGEVQ